MKYLAQLLERPGVEVPAIGLASGHRFVDSSPPDRVLDERARTAYREQVVDLQAEIDEAEGYADFERARRARLELEELLEQLARATGLAGSARAFDDEGERARTSVQKAIKRAVATIVRADPIIGEHLRGSVVTGLRCSYAPPPEPRGQ